MLVNISLIPFLLAVHANVSKKSDFDPEYLYELNKTSIAYREPFQITELTSTLICHPVLQTFLRCFLDDIVFITTLKYENLNVTEEITREKFSVKLWFDIEFNKGGVVSVIVGVDDRMIISLIKHIVSQFNIGSQASIDMLHPVYNPTKYTTKEITPIGTCINICNMEVLLVKKANEEVDNKFQIKPVSKHFVNQTNLRIDIVKNRENCNYSQDFTEFLNGMEVVCVHILFFIRFIFL
ncbi:hypothetical protein ALC62_13771 [Cyphomyrmex costatus]|uniref:Uncharacterized protein n=1 Tax=Cyphomyrmex costatus TaxID=456900 RepID=A0A195C656_9HYME|nr:hypothetical protein ALC62_13771 [Cyphomyrmex costatus]